jgi:RNA polymerase sigma factor (sigma-70 family)
LLATEGEVEDGLYRKEIKGLVHVALDHLPPRYGNALEWKYTHGLSLREIGARLGISSKAAESLLRRASATFKDAFCSLLGPGDNLVEVGRR